MYDTTSTTQGKSWFGNLLPYSGTIRGLRTNVDLIHFDEVDLIDEEILETVLKGFVVEEDECARETRADQTIRGEG